MTGVFLRHLPMARHLFDQGHDVFVQWRSTWLPLGLGLVLPHPPKQVTVPAQDGVRLDDDQSILPGAQLACQEHDQSPVAPSEFRTPGLPFENDYLMAQQRIFEQQFRLGAGHIQGRVQGQGMVVRPCPSSKRFFDSLPRRTYALKEGKERKVHGLPFG